MKKPHTIHWVKGVMRAFVTPELPKFPINGQTNYQIYEYNLKQARASSLAVADESVEKVKRLCAISVDYWVPQEGCGTWQPDFSKEYSIECELRKEVLCEDDGFDGYAIKCRNCHCKEAIVLLDESKPKEVTSVTPNTLVNEYNGVKEESQEKLWEEFWDIVYKNSDFFDPDAGQSRFTILRKTQYRWKIL